MEQRLIDIDAVKSVLKKVGIESEECDQCMGWHLSAIGRTFGE